MWEFRAAHQPDEVVCMRPARRQLRYLLLATSEACLECGTGVRHHSFWVTQRGSAECVTWCEHCFNACCEPVPLNEELRAEYRTVQAAIAARRVFPVWSAVRPALQDLERRTLYRRPE